MNEDADLDKAVVLVVDDTPDNLALMSGLLKDHYKVKVANAAEKALTIARAEPQPDLILLDVMMPVMDGHEACRRLKADPKTRAIPVIFLTARAEPEDERLGLELGAVDYITKPISPAILLARVSNHLKLKAAADFLRDKAAYLEREVARRTRELAAIQDVTIFALASLAETRDADTGQHIRRTQRYVGALARRMRGHSRFAAVIDDAFIDLLVKSAPLHDIGKVGIPDHILLKPGRLDGDEYAVMKSHAILGSMAIEHAERVLGKEVSFLSCAKDIARHHHEKWNGSGYPDGLSGEEISVPARLMAVADVYDALVTRRVYKAALTHEEAVNIIANGRGILFDPDIVDAFLDAEGEFRAIAIVHADKSPPPAASAWWGAADNADDTPIPMIRRV